MKHTPKPAWTLAIFLTLALVMLTSSVYASLLLVSKPLTFNTVDEPVVTQYVTVNVSDKFIYAGAALNHLGIVWSTQTLTTFVQSWGEASKGWSWIQPEYSLLPPLTTTAGYIYAPRDPSTGERPAATVTFKIPILRASLSDTAGSGTLKVYVFTSPAGWSSIEVPVSLISDGDATQTACSAVKGTWLALGDQKNCCGDDATEFYKISNLDKTGACCKTSSDCVLKTTCYQPDTSLDSDGDKKSDTLCTDGSLADCDSSSKTCAACDASYKYLSTCETANHGDYVLSSGTSGCCGDDTNEYPLTGMDGVSACCSQPSPYTVVRQGKCVKLAEAPIKPTISTPTAPKTPSPSPTPPSCTESWICTSFGA